MLLYHPSRAFSFHFVFRFHRSFYPEIICIVNGLCFALFSKAVASMRDFAL